MRPTQAKALGRLKVPLAPRSAFAAG